MTGDTIYLKQLRTFPPTVPASDPEYIKHVSCDGARWHVLRYSRAGVTCSEPKCILNKPQPTRQVAMSCNFRKAYGLLEDDL